MGRRRATAPNHLEVARRAQRDLRQLDVRVVEGIEAALTPNPPAENLDVKAVQGRRPWLRLRLGDYRVLFRPLTVRECRDLEVERGYLIARVVDRRDLDRAIRTLSP
jgi:mRNA-degrading endonuclease RelE of RelBE toxin-antitoxin system